MNLTIDDLNDGQRMAFDSVLSAIENKQHLMINGPAGTGKTTLTKFIIEYLMTNGIDGIQLAAPTHQAKKVLSKLAGLAAVTIHSLLKISPTNYEDVTAFQQADAPDLSECRVLICDEGSMYDRELFRILMASVPYHCTIIGLGDMAQLRPVAPGPNNVPELSPFFFNDQFKQVSLTEVMRSNAPIIEVATEIRNGKWIRECLLDGHGVHNMYNQNGGSIANFFGEYFEHVKDPDDLFENRILAFTNKSVDDLNGIVRRRLYGTTIPFIENEVIVMQEPLMKFHEFEGKKFSETIFNNGEHVRIMECRETEVKLEIGRYQETETIKVWKLQVCSLETAAVECLQVIHSENELNKFQHFMGKSAGYFKENRDSKPNWKGWWSIRGKFQKVKPLPCGTIHKSQGSTVDSAFLYTPCIHKADAALAQQLLYVGATRARTDVYFI